MYTKAADAVPGTTPTLKAFMKMEEQELNTLIKLFRTVFDLEKSERSFTDANLQMLILARHSINRLCL